jgi:hypothetical protein
MSERHAIVFLRDGRSYEGDTSIESGWVHFEGTRRHNTGDHVLYREAGERSWPRRLIREIRWSDRQDGVR